MEKKLSELEEIKKNLKSDKLVIGTSSCIKNLKLGKLSKIFVSSNTPQTTVLDIKQYKKLTDIDFIQLDVPNDELGMFCKKPYSVSVIGLLK